MGSVTLYGGPAHGRLAAATIPSRIEYSLQDSCDAGPPHRPESLCMELPATQHATYYIHEYRQAGVDPNRRRSIRIGIIEGCDLTPRETFDLQRAIQEVPWRFPKVSILYEFEEWWSQELYEATGRLEWRGERVRLL